MTQTETKYFDLHIQGIGYLNRVREVKPTRAEPFGRPISLRSSARPTTSSEPASTAAS